MDVIPWTLQQPRGGGRKAPHRAAEQGSVMRRNRMSLSNRPIECLLARRPSYNAGARTRRWIGIPNVVAYGTVPRRLAEVS